MSTFPKPSAHPAPPELDMQGLLAALRHGQTAVAPWVDDGLARAGERVSLGAFIHLDGAAARSAAAHADGLDAQRRLARPLHGLPIAVKDNIDVAGMPTTAGSPALAGHVPRRHATAVERLVAAGAVVVGKTNLHEFALGVTNNNAAFGPARNPYAPDRIAGGSSGGSAAAVAARLVPAALGTDTGGSIRIPAALCGVVGFRPSTGRWPVDGVVPISATRDAVGPIARRVADCALLDAVVCREPLALAPARLDGLRLGVPRRLFWDDLDPAMASAAEAVLLRLAAAGVELVPCDVAIDGDACAQVGLVIAMAENLSGLKRYFASHGLPYDARRIAAAAAGADVRAVFAHLLSADAPTPADHAHALQVQRRAFQAAYARCFAEQRIAALVFPTTPLPAARIGEDEVVDLCGRPVSTFFTYTRNAGPASVVGLPGISLPMGLSDNGLPLGIELDAPAGADRRLLAIERAVETLWPELPAPPPGMPAAPTPMRTIRNLYRYPVNVLSPEALDEVPLTAGLGFPLDREFALTNGGWAFEAATYQPRPKSDFLMLMQHERLAALRTRLDTQAGRISVLAPDGERVEAALDDPAALDGLAAFVGRHAGKALPGRPRLVRAQGKRFTDVSVVSPALMNSISLINLASVREVARVLGKEVNPLRFRANVYFDGGQAWEELGWLDQDIRLGDVRCRVVMRTRRCAATNVDPETGVRDLGIPQALLRNFRHGDLGVYAEVLADGALQAGVSLLPPTP